MRSKKRNRTSKEVDSIVKQIFCLKIILKRSLRLRPLGQLLLSLLLVISFTGVVSSPAAIAAEITPKACTDLALINGGFEIPSERVDFVTEYLDASIETSTVSAKAVPGIGWRTTQSDHLIEYWSSNYDWVPKPYEGSKYVELNARQAGALYQDISTEPGSSIAWSLAHRGRSGTDVMRVLIGQATGSVSYPGGINLVQQGDELVDGNTAWGVHQGVYVVPAGQTLTRFWFEAVSSVGGSSFGNYLDGISFSPTNCNSPIPTYDRPTLTPTSDGYTVQLTNYDSVNFSWLASVPLPASATISSTGLITVTGAPNASITVTVTASHTGYFDGSTTITGSSLGSAKTPAFGLPTAIKDGFTVDITNYDPNWNWSTPYVSAITGSVQVVSTSGSIRTLQVTGVGKSALTTLYQSTSRAGYSSGNGFVAGTSLAEDTSPMFSTPEITSPIQGYFVNGTEILISGIHFQSGAVAKIGTELCKSTVFVSAKLIKCIAKEHYVGPYNLTVLNLDTGTYTLENGLIGDKEITLSTSKSVVSTKSGDRVKIITNSPLNYYLGYFPQESCSKFYDYPAAFQPISENSFITIGFHPSSNTCGNNGKAIFRIYTSNKFPDLTSQYELGLTIDVVDQGLASATFIPNGGAGLMTIESAAGLAPLAENIFTRIGYSFKGWATSSEASVSYLDKASYDFLTDISLYAQWSSISSSVIDTPGPVVYVPAPPEPYLVAVTNPVIKKVGINLGCSAGVYDFGIKYFDGTPNSLIKTVTGNRYKTDFYIEGVLQSELSRVSNDETTTVAISAIKSKGLVTCKVTAIHGGAEISSSTMVGTAGASKALTQLDSAFKLAEIDYQALLKTNTEKKAAATVLSRKNWRSGVETAKKVFAEVKESAHTSKSLGLAARDQTAAIKAAAAQYRGEKLSIPAEYAKLNADAKQAREDAIASANKLFNIFVESEGYGVYVE